MNVALYSLLGFAAWTLLMLTMTVGIYRWSRVLTGRATVAEWRADEAQGTEWYRRAMRAHANCVENLPVFGAIVLVGYALGVDDPRFGWLAAAVLAARVIHTTIHLAFEQTEVVASLRFTFFFAQVLAMAGMIVLVL